MKDRPVGFYVLLLVLEAAMLGVFAARDVILFYVFFEFTLVPLFFLIGIWGHDERRRAAVEVLHLHARRQRAHLPRAAHDRALERLPHRHRHVRHRVPHRRA